MVETEQYRFTQQLATPYSTRYPDRAEFEAQEYAEFFGVPYRPLEMPEWAKDWETTLGVPNPDGSVPS